MKKVLSILLAAVLLLCAAAFTVSADYAGKTVILYSANLRGDVDVYAQIAAAKADYEKNGADVILVDAGNFLQGTAAANSDRGLSVYRLMDAAGYDAAALGLAELSYGDAATGMVYHGNVTRYHTQRELQLGCAETEYNVNRDGSVKGTLAAKEPAKFAALSANLTANVSWYSYAPSAVVTTGAGLKVGVYALTAPEAADALQDGFVSAVAAPEKTAVAGADLTVCLTNAKGVAADFADVVVDGSDGERRIGAFVVDNATKAVTAETVALSAADAEVQALADAAKANAAKTAFRSEVTLSGKDSVGWMEETNLGDLVTDALAWYAVNYFDGVDKTLPIVAIQNGGNCDQFVYPGDVTEVDLLRALPFSPMGMGAVELTGAQLLEVLEAATSPSERYGDSCSPGFAQVSGLTCTVDWTEDYDGGEAYGYFYRADSVNRVEITGVNGAAFDPEAKYLVVGDNYLMNGNDTYYTIKEARDGGAKYVNNGNGVKTRDAVAMYVEKELGGVIGAQYAEAQGRITVCKARFNDVTTRNWFYKDVTWAVEQGITKGTSATTFSPDDTCTHIQFITFLWRAAGGKADDGTDDFDAAEAWAKENGVVGQQFVRSDALRRSDMVQYLHAFSKAPASAQALSFRDVPADADYLPALRWAVESGVIRGTGDDTFSPDGFCTRCQTMAVLHRMLGA